MKKNRNTWAAIAAAGLLIGSTPSLHAQGYYNAWTQEFLNGADPSQGAKAIAVDSRGNVIVAGFNQKTFGGDPTVYLVKYSGGDGSIVWERTLSATNSMEPASVCVDSNDAVIVAGRRNGSGDDDFFVMKYNADGSQATGFANPVLYDGTAGGEDIPAKVVVDGDNNIIVAGKSVGSSANSDFYVRKYSPTGGFLNEERTSSPRFEEARDIAVDSANNIVVVGSLSAGSNDLRVHIRKLTPAFGQAFAAKSIDTGGRGGAVAVAIDQSTGAIYTAGLANNQTGEQGFYTIKYNSAGTFQWEAFVQPTDGDFTGTPLDIAVGPDGNPVVTGFLETSGSVQYARTVKYRASPAGQVGEAIWDTSDTGFIGEDTVARKVVVDNQNNVIVLGESVDSHGSQSSFNNKDVYVAKYDGQTGERTFFAGFNGSFSSSDDKGVDLAVDRFGDIAITSTPIRNRAVDIFTGRGEIATLKFNKFIAERGSPLPDAPPLVPANATFLSGSTPALGSDGSLATKIVFASGKTKKNALLVQPAGGDVTLPVVAGGDAPDAASGTEGKFASFSDPVVSANGDYAFSASLSGVSKSNSKGVWQSVGGQLRRVLQQGKPIPGADTLTFASASSLSMRNGQLLVVAKVAGSASSNLVLLSINSAGQATVLLQKGVTMVTVGTDEPSAVKSFTVLSPAPSSPADGRWQSTTAISVARLVLASKRSVHVRMTAAGTVTPQIATGQQEATISPSPIASLGLPAISAGLRFTTLATLQPVKGEIGKSNDSVLIYSPGSGTFSVYAREGDPAANDPQLQGTTYAGFSDPAMASIQGVSPRVAFLATLKGQGVGKKNNRALVYGDPTGTLLCAARTGGDAPAPASSSESPTTFSAISSFVLPNGASATPVFLATLAGPGTSKKNNAGLFAVSSTGDTRRLLRAGDVLGDRTVKSFTILKGLSQVSSAARGFNDSGSVAVAIAFTNGEQALLRIAIP